MGLSMGRFASKFLVDNSEILRHKQSRFTSFLKKAADGTLFQRPSSKPRWLAYMTYHEPMFGVLQSSYEDVEAELNILRNRHSHNRFLFVGGDGLSILRINHLIKDHPELYQDSAPFIIPVQGEAPHGVYHVMHAGWRLYIRLIRACANELNNAQVVDDPSVKQFNASLYFLWRMTRAIAEYFVQLSRTPGAPDIDAPEDFLTNCEFNVDLAWLAHFLYDFAFLVLDFKQQVRRGASDQLDLLWREFFALGRTSSANKTHYVPMSIMRIFWADALHPELAALYRQLRSIPMSQHEGSMVGWDCVIEWLNKAISQGVSHHVSEERISRFIKCFPLLEHNYAVLRGILLPPQQRHAAFMKDMDSDVGILKAFFIQNLGRDWATASRANSISKLGIGRGKAPWEEVDATMRQSGSDSTPALVERHVRNLTSSFYRWSP